MQMVKHLLSEQGSCAKIKSIKPAKPCDLWETKNSIEITLTTPKGAGLGRYFYCGGRNPAWMRLLLGDCLRLYMGGAVSGCRALPVKLRITFLLIIFPPYNSKISRPSYLFEFL